MPAPKSARGQQITSAAFEAPFETNITRFGVKGLNLIDALDVLEPDELSRMLNLTHRQNGGVTSRPGQTALLTGLGTNVHSVRTLHNPDGHSSIRIIGADGNLKSNTTTIDSGYSGDPLHMVPYRPPFSAETWMYVANEDRMRKVRSDGLDLPIGLPAPVSAPTVELVTEARTTIADLDGDGTAPSNWSGNAVFVGETADADPLNIVGEILDDIDDDESQPAIHFGAIPMDLVLGGGGPTPGTTTTGYYARFGIAKTMDLSTVGGREASDDDYIHLKLNFSHTQFIKEFRLYLVCSSTFSPLVIPGASGESGVNSDAYVKAFSANDFSAFVQAQVTQTDSAEAARVRSLRDADLEARRVTGTKQGDKAIPAKPGERRRTELFGFRGKSAQAAEVRLAERDVARTITKQSNAASDQWQPFGVLGIPLRRGDFQRIGTTESRDWADITGIVVYIQTAGSPEAPVGTVAVRISQLWMHGGYGPDTGEPEAQPYDYRYTNYDSRTGAESNPSDEMAVANFIDALRRGINVDPTAYGDSSIRQRIYRRGGSLPTDWMYLGENASDGGVFLDNVTDAEASASTAVEIDNDQPISTVDEDGETELAQPIPVLWGPLNDLIFGCGDPHRPGHVYFCKPGRPDSWPPDNIAEVCSPSEELMVGGVYGGQSFVFSKEKMYYLYPNLSQGTSVTPTPTQCNKGAINRWAMVAGVGGIYFIARDGIYRTTGGPEEWLSRKIDPLFRGKTVNGYLPIDFDHAGTMRLEIHENELYFLYTDTAGNRKVLVGSILGLHWRAYSFAQQPSVFYSEEGVDESILLMGGRTTGELYSHTGFSDDGTAISCNARTGALNFGRPREEKRLGDQVLRIDTQDVDVSLINYLNHETVTNGTSVLDTASGFIKSIFDGFGDTPQRASELSTDISWSSAAAAPVMHYLGTSIIVEPDITVNRVTQWDDLGHPDGSYLMGVTFDCDTGGENRTIIVERDYNGTISTVATLTVNTSGRHKRTFSWSGTQCLKVRLRPDDDCLAWQLFKVDWISQVEPPNISKWDSYFENGWDQYYTGLDLYCDTFGANKTVEVYVDGTLVKTETVNTSGRLVRHITLPWGRGHVFRFIATDDNPGQLYDFRWHLDPEPSEQTNWNQNFTVEGSEADKYLKALIFQCDTYGANKTVTVECDGVVVETLTVNTNGRKVDMQSFPQHLGRVFRIYPTDSNPGRLYSVQWIFDQEPLALERWETQEITHGFSGWHFPTFAHITLKSSATVTLQVTAYNQSGTATTVSYTISSTSGTKQKRFVPFQAGKGILYKYILTSDDPFWLYREETSVMVREWGSAGTVEVKPFGNDDMSTTRSMTNASLAAAKGGGGTA